MDLCSARLDESETAVKLGRTIDVVSSEAHRKLSLGGRCHDSFQECSADASTLEGGIDYQLMDVHEAITVLH
jgi:hypothetical protein